MTVQFYPAYYKQKVRYIPKTKITSEEEEVSNEVIEVTQNLNSNKLSEEIEKNVKNIKGNKVINDEAEISLDESQQALEEKSDNETLEPDEESIEAPIIFEIELMTKNGSILHQCLTSQMLF